VRKIHIWKAILKTHQNTSIFVEAESMTEAVKNSIKAFNSKLDLEEADLGTVIKEGDLQQINYMMEVWICEY